MPSLILKPNTLKGRFCHPYLKAASLYSQTEGKILLNIKLLEVYTVKQNTNSCAYWLHGQQAAFAPMPSSQVKIILLWEWASLYSLSFTIFSFHSFSPALLFPSQQFIQQMNICNPFKIRSAKYRVWREKLHERHYSEVGWLQTYPTGHSSDSSLCWKFQINIQILLLV